jgi:hypothetical protein
MLLRLLARIFVVLLFSWPVAAQEPGALLTLPQLNACERSSLPRLPEKWHATYLMAPFAEAQLVLGDIVYDAAFPAMRVKLLGVRRGAVDLLVFGNITYVLEDPQSSAKRCRALGDTGWRPLPQDWLQARSQCFGSATIGETAVDWWRTAIAPTPASYWIWYKTSDQTPFRLVFPHASDRLAPVSRFALSYQVGFTQLAQTDLEDIAALCRRSAPTRARNGRRALAQLIEGMSHSHHRADDEIARLFPALDASCPNIDFARWPEKVVLTGLMTPLDSDEPPYPTEVLYDWTVPGQRTRTFAPPNGPIAAQDSLLLGARGYTVTHYRRNRLVCRSVLPGTIRPDWASRAPCQCAAVINGTTTLSPYGTTQVMVCPLSNPRVAWAWYALAGRPTTFMVTSRAGDEGKGLFAVLDYRDWLPGYPSPRAAFDRPPQCAPRADSPPHPSKRCSSCHLGPSSP